MYSKAHEVKKEDKRFVAALKGIDLDEGESNEFDEIKQRAEAKAAGISEDEYEFDGFFNVINEE